jgi:hypothetical protein
VDPETHEPVRYNPCAPIHYVINDAYSPPGGTDDIHAAIERVEVATGLQFEFDGTTSESPATRRESYQPETYGKRWAPILIAWVPGELAIPGASATGAQTALGLGGSRYEVNEDGRPVYVTGQVSLAADAGLSTGFGGETWGLVIMHEMGHIVGLDHVSDPSSMMNTTSKVQQTVWGLGDKIGLRELGLGSSCLRPPPLP